MANAGIPLHAKYGYIVVAYGATPTNPNAASDTTFFALDNSEVNTDSMAIEDDVTTSYNQIGTRKLAGLIDGTIDLTLPEDDPSSVEAQTLVRGQYYTLWCRRGDSVLASHQWDSFVGCCFMGLKKTNPTATGVKRTVTAQFKGGDYTGYTAISAAGATAIAAMTPART